VPRPDAPPSFDHDFATSAGVLDVVWITGSYDTLAGSARLVHHHDLPVRVVDTSALRHRMNNSDRIKDRVRTAAIDGRIDGIEVVLAGRREVVVAKPAGVAAEMRADVDGVSLLERIRRNGWPEARLPHRLDRVSSGLQVVAWDAAAVADHNRTIASGGWTKRYIARIDRRHADDPAALLGEHRRHLRREGRVARVVRSGGKPSVLIVEEVAPDPVRADCAQVAVRLLTGRYHQVRAMLADLGAPLVGDDRYGGRDDPDGPWLEQVELTLPLVGLPGTQRIVLPEHCRRFDVAPAIMDGLLHRRPHRQASDGTSHRST
jgi:23S rRNA-/tRNA-specific pseudouridylate synthase